MALANLAFSHKINSERIGAAGGCVGKKKLSSYCDTACCRSRYLCCLFSLAMLPILQNYARMNAKTAHKVLVTISNIAYGNINNSKRLGEAGVCEGELAA
jgi:hypothetical protein